ncbi:MAG: hypothetical protein P5683_08030 [Limnospira sp. PMC 1279.21]|uniref:hypothetical protein n=1 Tax=unclassified Limnospira TaxID=2642885 RepID=UPI0028E17B28|nr:MULTISPECIES: hypothetical protein [unclassified Limnospira]MDT9284627.1 hypothetical protein [Limnospira sp. PMC 1298.21]MDT9315425.1 hypothetical protein [Limnospira sp. PMC 1306.21]MDT9192689.1 hypothetical protein [Limnospira sp. PMC 1245.20]MDT9208155.1 hypothetical protein [Limnospira sp. PMC 1252.20]MDT9213266.1 hypothetical protein [Limnospira sp. PMC 1256.20]
MLRTTRLSPVGKTRFLSGFLVSHQDLAKKPGFLTDDLEPPYIIALSLSPQPSPEREGVIFERE